MHVAASEVSPLPDADAGETEHERHAHEPVGLVARNGDVHGPSGQVGGTGTAPHLRVVRRDRYAEVMMSGKPSSWRSSTSRSMKRSSISCRPVSGEERIWFGKYGHDFMCKPPRLPSLASRGADFGEGRPLCTAVNDTVADAPSFLLPVPVEHDLVDQIDLGGQVFDVPLDLRQADFAHGHTVDEGSDEFEDENPECGQDADDDDPD